MNAIRFAKSVKGINLFSRALYLLVYFCNFKFLIYKEIILFDYAASVDQQDKYAYTYSIDGESDLSNNTNTTLVALE